MSKKTVIVLNPHREPIKGAHTSIRTKTEPITHTFDASELGKGPAAEIRAYVAREIAKITKTVSGSTAAKRSRLGISSRRLYNATGRLARDLTVAKSGDEYQTRAPADRFADVDTKSLLPRLLDLIHIDAKEIVADKGVRGSIEATLGAIFKKGRLK